MIIPSEMNKNKIETNRMHGEKKNRACPAFIVREGDP